MLITGLSLLSLAAWVFLLAAWGGFWRADQALVRQTDAPSRWRDDPPDATILVPARNEAAVIRPALESLLAQDYPGRLSVLLIDDGSSDGTAEIAAEVAAADPRLEVMHGADLPAGWTGKLWALQQGVERVLAKPPSERPGYLWMSDADIRHAPDILRRLVAKAEAEDRDLVSVMARLDVSSGWARLLIPAFIYFFQKLYPFSWVNDPAKRLAAAAGGCVLIRTDALASVDGYRPIRDALIDDVALGRLIKHRERRRAGAIWLGFAAGVDSLRPAAGLSDIWQMVVRTAFTQLHHSVLLLVGTVFGMALLYLLPPAITLLGALGWVGPVAGLAGVGAYGLMTFSLLPTLRRYRQTPWLALALPVAGLLYTAMTVDSARRYWQGKGGAWKGRAQARRTS